MQQERNRVARFPVRGQVVVQDDRVAIRQIDSMALGLIGEGSGREIGSGERLRMRVAKQRMRFKRRNVEADCHLELRLRSRSYQGRERRGPDDDWPRGV